MQLISDQRFSIPRSTAIPFGTFGHVSSSLNHNAVVPNFDRDMAKTSLATKEIIQEIIAELQPLPELELQVRQIFAAEGNFLCYATTVIQFHIVVCLSTRKSAAQGQFLCSLDMILRAVYIVKAVVAVASLAFHPCMHPPRWTGAT